MPRIERRHYTTRPSGIAVPSQPRELVLETSRKGHLTAQQTADTLTTNTGPCDPVTIYASDGTTILTTVDSGGSYTVPACPSTVPPGEWVDDWRGYQSASDNVRVQRYQGEASGRYYYSSSGHDNYQLYGHCIEGVTLDYAGQTVFASAWSDGQHHPCQWRVSVLGGSTAANHSFLCAMSPRAIRPLNGLLMELWDDGFSALLPASAISAVNVSNDILTDNYQQLASASGASYSADAADARVIAATSQPLFCHEWVYLTLTIPTSAMPSGAIGIQMMGIP